MKIDNCLKTIPDQIISEMLDRMNSSIKINPNILIR